MDQLPALTDKDEALIGLLRANGRESVANLARKLGLSRSSVQDRLRRLESCGVIAGYTVRLAPAAVAGIRAHVMIEVQPQAAAALIVALRSEPMVETLHTVSGKCDLVALVAACTTQRLDQWLDRLAEFDGVIRTESAIILSSKLDRRSGG